MSIIQNDRIGDNGMKSSRWKELKAIKWRPYRPSAFRRQFAESTKTVWAGYFVPHLPTGNLKRKDRKKLKISARRQRLHGSNP